MTHSNAPVRVLVVDDDAVIREGLKAFLEDLDYEVTALESGEAAMREITEAPPPRVAVIDLRLPGMSGEQLILALRQRFHAAMRFVIFTGSVRFYPDKTLQQIGIGPEEVFRKPLYDAHRIGRKIAQLAQLAP
ncbi:MAG: response regulator [Magnetococcales bacterium]|nr:response regulator [Magnetococcales bacterium]